MTSAHPPARIVVTGATGAVGRKAVETLARQDWCKHIIGLDLQTDQAEFSPAAQQRLTLAAADLERPAPSWTRHFANADAVLHLAARHSTPDASWEEALGSYSMTLNTLTAAATHGARRFVFASSNHAMGGYKDLPLSAALGPGGLTAAHAPAPGTRWFDGVREVHSLAYGTSKVMGERLCQAYAAVTDGKLSTVALRIGWALPGPNDPRDISYSGVAHQHPDPAAPTDEASRRALAWFRGMWLSNDDMERLFVAALTADSRQWDQGFVIVNGVSANRGSVWDVADGRRAIGYDPRDDIQARLG